jgi:hypothetical protein
MVPVMMVAQAAAGGVTRAASWQVGKRSCVIPSASARADSAPRRFRCGSLLPAADSAHKYPIGYFLRQGCRRALVRWGAVGCGWVRTDPTAVCRSAVCCPCFLQVKLMPEKCTA